MADARHIHGFSLIELLVALAVLAILTTQLFLVFQTQKATYITNERALDAQEDARLVMDLIAGEARMTGYMVPERAGVATIDGGTSDADDLCVSDSTVINDAALDGQADHFDRARLASVDSGTQITLRSAAHLNVDGDSSLNDFSVGQGLIISDGSVSHCARIVAIDTSSGEIDFDEPLASASVTALNANIGAVRAVPAVIYRVAGGLGLTRNGVTVSSEVEDLQVEFGVDTDGDSQLVTSGEFPVNSLSGSSAEQVRAIRISVVARSPQPDPDYAGSDRGRPATANRSAGSSDTFLRRRFVSRVLPRNLM